MITLFQLVAESPVLFGACLVAHIVSMALVTSLANSLTEEYDGVVNPDQLFGYSAVTLNGIYSTWGEDGCLAYSKIALYDFVAVMPFYSIFWGAWLFRACRRVEWSDKLSNLLLLAVTSDVVETYLQLKGCLIYPETLSNNIILVASCCNIMKWIGVYSGMGLTLVALVLSRVRSKKSHKA